MHQLFSQKNSVAETRAQIPKACKKIVFCKQEITDQLKAVFTLFISTTGKIVFQTCGALIL